MEIWEEFTNDVIKYVSENNDKCVFVLLGGFAKAREAFIKDKKRVVKGVHPSGLSAHKGFFGSGIFKKIEELLEHQVDWSN
jgi:uracil-DNA glycosylase